MAKRHYTLYCDESAKWGPHYSNFYGGVLVSSEDREAIEAALLAKKIELNLNAELKWTKVTENYLQKYIEFVRYYFKFIQTGRLKVRIMFTHNFHEAVGLSSEQLEDRYFILYYQLIKHAFGFKYCNPNNLDRIYISVLLDDLPDTKEKAATFKAHVARLSQVHPYQGRGIFFPPNQIADVRSHDHTILQGLDIILGAMQFRLNDLHKQKPVGARRRGKRTIAKEKLYKEINRQVREIYPGFNIGSTTGHAGGRSDRWSHPYRHWVLVPKQKRINEAAAKG